MNIKKGNEIGGGQSVKGGMLQRSIHIPHEPGLFTRIMPAMVMPLKMSRASNRLGVFAVMCVRLINWLTRTKITFY